MEAGGNQTGIVTTEGGNLNVRSYPSFNGYVVATIPNGSQVTILGKYEDWYVIQYGDITGYVNENYIII